jgi:hypothetical protein
MKAREYAALSTAPSDKVAGRTSIATGCLYIQTTLELRMAEIIGVIAGVAGLARTSSVAASRLSDIFTAWKRAPDELMALSNEVEDMRLLLEEISNTRTVVEEASDDKSILTRALSSQIKEGQQLINSLSSILDRLTLTGQYQKKYRWVKSREEVNQLRLKFREVRRRIQAALIGHLG